MLLSASAPGLERPGSEAVALAHGIHDAIVTAESAEMARPEQTTR